MVVGKGKWKTMNESLWFTCVPHRRVDAGKQSATGNRVEPIPQDQFRGGHQQGMSWFKGDVEKKDIGCEVPHENTTELSARAGWIGQTTALMLWVLTKHLRVRVSEDVWPSSVLETAQWGSGRDEKGRRAKAQVVDDKAHGRGQVKGCKKRRADVATLYEI